MSAPIDAGKALGAKTGEKPGAFQPREERRRAFPYPALKEKRQPEKQL